MRIGTNQQFQGFSARIANAQTRMEEAREKAITGQRFTRAAQDPASASRVVRLKGLHQRIDRLGQNVQHAEHRLGGADNALAGVNDLAVRARTLTLQAASPGLPLSSRQAIASELQEMRERLVSLGNTQDASGQHIFAGRNSGEKPFLRVDGQLQNRGDQLPVRAEIRPGEQMDLGSPGAQQLILDLDAQLDELSSNVLGADFQSLSEDRLSQLDTLSRSALTMRADVGSKLQRLQTVKEEHARQKDDLAAQASDAQDVDLAQALTELKSAELAYTASMQTISQGMNLSLMDFLR
jgi:flagellar hook-associated protein 3 FlgL